MQNNLATLRQECLFTIIMSLKRKRPVLLIKDNQSIILQLGGTNLSAEYGVRKQQIPNICKYKENITKFADTCRGIHSRQ